VHLVADRKMTVLAVGEEVIGVTLARGPGELEAHAGHIGAATIGGGFVGDWRGRVAILAAVAEVAVAVVTVAVAVAIGEYSPTLGKRPVAQ
jgi:hypothetical protein